MRPELHYSFSEGQLVYHCGTRIDLIAKNGLFYLRLEPVRWLQRHTHVIAFQFLGEGRDSCGLVAQRFHVSPIPMIYDSGAFVLVPARKKSLRMALCFLRSISACSNQPTAHAGGVHIRHSVWHTVLYGFIWCASCLHRESKWFPICCEFRRRIFYVCDYFMRTKFEVTTKLEEVISDLQSPWKAHWPYYIGFKVALEGALAVFVWIWVAINAIIVETVASLECKWKWEQSLSVNARILSSRGHLQVCRKSMEYWKYFNGWFQKWFMLICIKTVCLQYSGSSLTDRQPGFSIGFFTARSRSSPFSCMREEHALNDCIICFVIVPSRFLGLHLESTRGGRWYIEGFHRHAM